ncbi:hypothetical protein GMRT_12304 [Giardia muris]|uniref:Uncharacterized protein n=1 Tax=Giardia muris TaxID=5742 RepID=A0A4Z1TDC8_GIAMU|nr:hypothetical protein GMRT_12304 [Giardia muris]|eukprot:TNJ30539.1 hypothetical protein GMRT_12304 [Giardia muris]
MSVPIIWLGQEALFVGALMSRTVALNGRCDFFRRAFGSSLGYRGVFIDPRPQLIRTAYQRATCQGTKVLGLSFITVKEYSLSITAEDFLELRTIDGITNPQARDIFINSAEFPNKAILEVRTSDRLSLALIYTLLYYIRRQFPVATDTMFICDPTDSIVGLLNPVLTALRDLVKMHVLFLGKDWVSIPTLELCNYTLTCSIACRLAASVLVLPYTQPDLVASFKDKSALIRFLGLSVRGKFSSNKDETSDEKDDKDDVETEPTLLQKHEQSMYQHLSGVSEIPMLTSFEGLKTYSYPVYAMLVILHLLQDDILNHICLHCPASAFSVTGQRGSLASLHLSFSAHKTIVNVARELVGQVRALSGGNYYALTHHAICISEQATRWKPEIEKAFLTLSPASGRRREQRRTVPKDFAFSCLIYQNRLGGTPLFAEVCLYASCGSILTDLFCYLAEKTRTSIEANACGIFDTQRLLDCAAHISQLRLDLEAMCT